MITIVTMWFTSTSLSIPTKQHFLGTGSLYLSSFFRFERVSLRTRNGNGGSSSRDSRVLQDRLFSQKTWTLRTRCGLTDCHTKTHNETRYVTVELQPSPTWDFYSVRPQTATTHTPVRSVFRTLEETNRREVHLVWVVKNLCRDGC